MKEVFAIYESSGNDRERARWVRVGVAFDNRDGSVNVLLDALPLTGRLQIRDRPDRTEQRNSSGTRRRRAERGAAPESPAE